MRMFKTIVGPNLDQIIELLGSPKVPGAELGLIPNWSEITTYRSHTTVESAAISKMIEMTIAIFRPKTFLYYMDG